MGKKGAKRKTRWRTLSIGTPPGEEDEEDDKGSGHPHPRNGYAAWHKSRHGSAGSSSGGSAGNGNGGSTTSGYASSRSRRADDSPTHNNRVIFNEEEYTRITTPRQDMLFKKGYLSQRKPWNPACSSTPSTNESQSASHSTADGSEAAEDQQLLDCSLVPASEIVTAVPLMDPTHVHAAAAAGYPTTYYDHATGGYYYEYPTMMLLTADPQQSPPYPIAAVPLRPIEWVNPAYVPKLASQQYCYMDYQTTHTSDCAALVDAQGVPLTMVETAPGLTNAKTELQPTEEFTPKSSEMQEVVAPEQQQPLEQSQEEQPAVVEYAEVSYPVETLPAQPMHHVVPQTCGPQSYVYPGQYMFGSPVVNEGITVSNGPMLRCSDMVTSTGAVMVQQQAKRRRKKKKRKQKRPIALVSFPPYLGTMEDDDEEDYYSSEENSLSSPRVSSWSSPPLSSSVPLNPECQEFHLPPATSVVKSTTQLSEASVSSPEFYPTSYTATTTIAKKSNELRYDESTVEFVPKAAVLSNNNHMDNEAKRLTDGEENSRDTTPASDYDNPVVTNGGHDEHEEEPTIKTLTNGDLTNCNNKNLDANGCLVNGEEEEEEEKVNDNKLSLDNNLVTRHTTDASCIKYNGNGNMVQKTTLISEPDLGKRLSTTTENSNSPSTKTCSKDSDSRSIDNVTAMLSATSIIEAEVSQKGGDSDNWLNESSITSESCWGASEKSTPKIKNHQQQQQQQQHQDEDSGFESQSRPITEAVSEWLKRASNSPDLFIVSPDEDEETDKKSKNLQGNPMPALSANGEEARQNGRFASCDRTKRNRRKGRKSWKKDSKPIPEDQKTVQTTVEKSLSVGIDHLVDKNYEPELEELENSTVCESTDKDSDAGMRVAENYSRINKLTTNEEDYNHQNLKTECKRPVRTYEKGEIVVSMDGELLLVQEACTPDRRESITSSENTLGSIEEPDVLDCWEPETVEPLPVSPILEHHHVEKYYRLQERLPPQEVEDDDDEEEEIDEEPVISSTVPGQDSEEYSRIPVEEAFEVYESCYTGKPMPTLGYRIDREDEAPVPCKAVCCTIQ